MSTETNAAVEVDEAALAFAERLKVLETTLAQAEADRTAANQAWTDATAHVQKTEAAVGALPMDATEEQRAAATMRLIQARTAVDVAKLRAGHCIEAATSAKTARDNAVYAERRRTVLQECDRLTSERLALVKHEEDLAMKKLLCEVGLNVNLNAFQALAQSVIPRDMHQRGAPEFDVKWWWRKQEMSARVAPAVDQVTDAGGRCQALRDKLAQHFDAGNVKPSSGNVELAPPNVVAIRGGGGIEQAFVSDAAGGEAA